MKNDIFINIWDYISTDYPFQVFTGARGRGKTYSALKGLLEGRMKKFIFMRRTEDELELLYDSEHGEGANPFKKINENEGSNYGFRPIRKHIGGIYDRDPEGKAIGAPVGYALALSTIAKIRGADFSDVDVIIFDEFIAEAHVKKIKEEGTAILNAYETINRNREFEGQPPVLFIFLSNSNNIYTPFFVTIGIVNIIEKMIATGKNDFKIPQRKIALHLLPNSEEFVEKKSSTALYALTAGTQFADMALKNEFAYNDFSLVKYRNVREFRPMCALDNAFIYIGKSNPEYYISYAPAQCKHFDSKREHEKISFMREFGIRLNNAFASGRVTFESYDLKAKILNVIM